MAGDPRFDWTGPEQPPFVAPAAAPTLTPAARVPVSTAARSTKVVLLAVLVPIAAVVLIGIVAAVAVPVLLNERAADTGGGDRLVLPVAVQGLPVVDEPEVQQQLDELAAQFPADVRSATSAKAYGFPGGREALVVFVVDLPMDGTAQTAFTRGFENALVPTGLVERQGPFGSTGWCGVTANGRSDVCWTTAGNGVVAVVRIAERTDPANYPAMLDVRLAVTGTAGIATPAAA